jgi:Endonuclease-reverse transcriptase
MDPDLILVTESWCNDQITNAFLSVPGYELIQDLRLDMTNTDKGCGGGLLVYSKNNLPVCVLPFDNRDDGLQYCKFRVKDLTVFLIYRSPSGGPTSVSGLSDLIREAEKNSLFFGDFNLPEIDWENGTARGRARELFEAANDRLMEQLVTCSTHVRGNILDLLLTDCPERVVDVTEEGRLGASDHVILLAKITVCAGPPPHAAMRSRAGAGRTGKE